MGERLFIRILVGVALFIALTVFVLVPVPTAGEAPALPAAAFGQPGIYRLEVALLTFYGGLLLITPAFSGLVRARLPIEISARGAKFAVEVDQPPSGPEQAEIKELHQVTKRLADELAVVKRDMKQLRTAATVTVRSQQ
jgi:hypothetical protein